MSGLDWLLIVSLLVAVLGVSLVAILLGVGVWALWMAGRRLWTMARDDQGPR